MKCPNCNFENNDGVTFCVHCGSKLDDSSSYRDNYQNNADNGNQMYQQQMYQQQNYNYQPVVKSEDEHMTVGGWVGIFCINLIPFVGSLIYLIMLFVWAFGSTPKKSLKTFARAQLIMLLIIIAIAIIVILILAVTGFFALNSFNNYSYYSYY